MPDGQAYFDRWMHQHARCETCRCVTRSLFGLVCGMTEEVTEADATCSDWQPFGDFAPAFEQVVGVSLGMDLGEGGYLHS